MTFHTPLLQFVRRRVADEASAEAIVQDVFLKVHTHIDAFKHTSKLQSWLYQLTRNVVIDHYRRRRDTVAISEEIPAFVQDDENGVVAQLTPTVKAIVWTWPHDACHHWEEISSHVVAVQSALCRSYTARAI